jgi:hypothetical protein
MVTEIAEAAVRKLTRQSRSHQRLDASHEAIVDDRDENVSVVDLD